MRRAAGRVGLHWVLMVGGRAVPSMAPINYTAYRGADRTLARDA